MTPAEAAAYLGGISVKTLAKWRHLGTGPQWQKAGRSVRYRLSDIDAWLKTREGTR